MPAPSTIIDGCVFVPTSGGTGSFVELTALSGYQTMEAAGALDGQQFSYRAQTGDLTQWEIGTGIWTASTKTLTRVVLFNSLGTTAAINFLNPPQILITALASDIPPFINTRLFLTGNVTYYVNNTTGNDANPGTLAAPWRSLQHANDWISAHVDFNVFVVQIQLADSPTVYGGVNLTSFFSSTVGFGTNLFGNLTLPGLQIRGNTVTPANVKVGNPPYGNGGAFYVTAPSIGVPFIYITGVRCVNTNGPCIACDPGVAGETGVVLGTWGGFSSDPSIEFGDVGTGQPILAGNISDTDGQTGGLFNGTITGATFTGTPSALYQALAGAHSTLGTQANIKVTGALTVSVAVLEVNELNCGIEFVNTFFFLDVAASVTGPKYLISNGTGGTLPPVDITVNVSGANASGSIDGIIGSLPGQFVTGFINDGTTTRRIAPNTGANFDGFVNYKTPLTGFTITLNNYDGHVILDPAGTLASGTINLPPAPADGQLVNIRTSRAITSFTLASAATILGAPTSLTAGQVIEGLYRNANTTWYF